MATTYEGPIQDLNTNNVSFLAYYQVSDDEITGEFNPDQIQFQTDSDDRLQPQRTDVYDNGIEMKVDDTLVNNTITLRAGNKNHKWVTAHLDSYSSDNGGEFTHSGTDITDPTNFQYSGGYSSLNGSYDLMPWTDENNGYDSSQNTLFNVINKSLLSSDFWDRSSLNTSNSGIYNYDVGSDHTISIFGIHESGSKETYGFSYTDTTTIHSAYFVGSVDTGVNDSLRIDINGTRVYNITGGYFANNITEIVDNQKQFKIGANDSYTRTKFSLYCIVSWS